MLNPKLEALAAQWDAPGAKLLTLAKKSEDTVKTKPRTSNKVRGPSLEEQAEKLGA